MTKMIILVRHGQYLKEPHEKLTALGRKQAVLAGKRLKQFKIDKVIASTMPRAQETAALIVNSFTKKQKIHSDKLLEECIPGFPMKLRKKSGLSNYKKFGPDKKQATKAFNKYFKFSNRPTTEVLVCHGNIIRFLVCKSLGVPILTWTKMDIKQCGITVIFLKKKSRTIGVVSHNDIGHIPLKMQTFI